MQVSQKRSLVGKYAIYFHSLYDTIAERRRAFFGTDRAKLLKPHDPSYATKEQEEPKTESEQSGEPKSGIEKLEGVVEKAQNILIKSSAVFPFDLFPDSITADRQKLTVVHRAFFNTKQTVSVQYSDIKNIQADIGPFLVSLTVTSEHFINNTQTIRYLPKKEALAIQQLVQGFIIANTEKVDMSDIDDKKLAELLNRLGRGEAGEKVVPPTKL